MTSMPRCKALARPNILMRLSVNRDKPMIYIADYFVADCI